MSVMSVKINFAHFSELTVKKERARGREKNNRDVKSPTSPTSATQSPAASPSTRPLRGRTSAEPRGGPGYAAGPSRAKGGVVSKTPGLRRTTGSGSRDSANTGFCSGRTHARARKRARPAFLAAPGPGSAGWTIPRKGGRFPKNPRCSEQPALGDAELNRNNFRFCRAIFSETNDLRRGC